MYVQLNLRSSPQHQLHHAAEVWKLCKCRQDRTFPYLLTEEVICIFLVVSLQAAEKRWKSEYKGLREGGRSRASLLNLGTVFVSLEELGRLSSCGLAGRAVCSTNRKSRPTWASRPKMLQLLESKTESRWITLLQPWLITHQLLCLKSRFF